MAHNGTSEAEIARLEKCAAVWKATPALWIEKPNYAGIVQVRSVSHNARGFHLSAEIEEILLATRERSAKTLRLGCNWNNDLATITEEALDVPYCFSLRFEAEGVARLRQAWALLPVDKNGRRVPFPNLFNMCFGVGKAGGSSREEFERAVSEAIRRHR